MQTYLKVIARQTKATKFAKHFIWRQIQTSQILAAFSVIMEQSFRLEIVKLNDIEPIKSVLVGPDLI